MHKSNKFSLRYANGLFAGCGNTATAIRHIERPLVLTTPFPVRWTGSIINSGQIVPSSCGCPISSISLPGKAGCPWRLSSISSSGIDSQISDALVHHDDRGSQYASIRYSERLGKAGMAPSVGSRGDSDDNALAKTVNGLYKTGFIHRRAPWKTMEAVEPVTLEGCPDSITIACSNRSAISRQPKLRQTTSNPPSRQKPFNLNQPASTRTEAIRSPWQTKNRGNLTT